jgi:hypothetical protein
MHQMGIEKHQRLHLIEMALHALELMLCALDISFREKFSGSCNVLEGTPFEIIRMLTGFTFVFFHHQRITVT